VHGLPARVGIRLHPALRDQMSDKHIIAHLRYRTADAMTVRAAPRPKRVTLYSPDLPKPRRINLRAASHDDMVRIDLSGIRRYYIVEMVMP
jgi:hypothetical protein